MNCCPNCNYKGVEHESDKTVFFGEEHCGKPDCPCHKPTSDIPTRLHRTIDGRITNGVEGEEITSDRVIEEAKKKILLFTERNNRNLWGGFIKQELLSIQFSYREEVVKMIKGMEQDPKEDDADLAFLGKITYNQALTDIIAKLNEI